MATDGEVARHPAFPTANLDGTPLPCHESLKERVPVVQYASKPGVRAQPSQLSASLSHGRWGVIDRDLSTLPASLRRMWPVLGGNRLESDSSTGLARRSPRGGYFGADLERVLMSGDVVIRDGIDRRGKSPANTRPSDRNWVRLRVIQQGPANEVADEMLEVCSSDADLSRTRAWVGTVDEAASEIVASSKEGLGVLFLVSPTV